MLPYFGANVLFAAGLWGHAFLYNFYLQALGHDESVMGWAAAALTAGGLTALAPAGLVLDRWGPRPAYLAAAGLAGVGLGLGAFTEQAVAIYAAAFLAGAGAAGWRVAMGPTLLALASGDVRARAFSWNVALLIAFGAVWTYVAGQAPDRLSEMLGGGELTGLRATLLLSAIGTLAAAPAFLLVRVPLAPRPAESAGQPGDGTFAAALALPRSLALLVGCVLVWMLAAGLVLPFFNIYFQRTHGLDVGSIGTLFAAVQVVSAAAVFAGGELVRRFGPERAYAGWALVFAPALVLLGLPLPVASASALYTLASLVPPATNPILDQILLERASRGREGVVSSWRNAATEASGFLGAGTGGVLLRGAGFGALFAVAGLLAAVGALALAAALRRAPAPPTDA